MKKLFVLAMVGSLALGIVLAAVAAVNDTARELERLRADVAALQDARRQNKKKVQESPPAGTPAATAPADATEPAAVEAAALPEEQKTQLIAEAAELRELLLGSSDPGRGLDAEALDVASSEAAGGAALGRLLPLLSVLVVLSGGAFAALSAFAGERESQTLETLLVQPVPPAPGPKPATPKPKPGIYEIPGPVAPGETNVLTRTASNVVADVTNTAEIVGSPATSDGVVYPWLPAVRDTDPAIVVVAPPADQAGGLHRIDEIGVLGQESVAGMNRVDVVPDGDFDQRWDIEIGLDRFTALLGSDEVRFVGLQTMQGKAVLIAVHGNGVEPEFTRRADDADGDLAPIGNEQFLHCSLIPEEKTQIPGHAGSRHTGQPGL